MQSAGLSLAAPMTDRPKIGVLILCSGDSCRSRMAEAEGVCDGSFRACPSAGACGIAHIDPPTPGCDNVDCCNRVCLVDPFCCLTQWDAQCVDEASAESMCP